MQLFTLFTCKILTSVLLFVQSIDRVGYYEVLARGGHDAVKIQLLKVKGLGEGSEKNALLGALYMKQSQFEKTAKLKLETFNKGKLLLENEITKYPYNTEYRFLRLIIQENAPKFLKYNQNIGEDATYISANFSKANVVLQGEIKKYANHSIALKNKQL